MRKILSLSAVVGAAIMLASCGGTSADSDSSPFVGKIDFKAEAMGMSTGGSMTVDIEKKQITYRLDKIKEFLGMDIVTLVDLENNVTYSISPSNKVYMKMEIPKKDIKGELPSKQEVEKMKKEFFSKLKATGKEKVISGYNCAEYEIKEKVESIEKVTVWVSKSLLDRIAPMWGAYSEIADLGIEEMLIGFPMMATGKAEGQTFSYEVTKITEGKEVLADLDLSGMEELSQTAFMMKVMNLEDNPFGDLMKGLEGMEGLEEGMNEFKDNMSAEDLEKMFESMK